MIVREIKQAILFTIVGMLVFGGGYHVALWAIGRVAFPAQAEGSLIRRPDGTIIGSRLIAQKFTRPEYFQPRPSGVNYNAASTGGTNYGPSNPDHLKAVQERLDVITKQDGVTAGEVPSEMVTASGGGLDPHIPPAAAALQARRGRIGPWREPRAGSGSHSGAHRAADVRFPRPGPGQCAGTEPCPRLGARTGESGVGR